MIGYIYFIFILLIKQASSNDLLFNNKYMDFNVILLGRHEVERSEGLLSLVS